MKRIIILFTFVLLFALINYRFTLAEQDEWVCPECGNTSTVNFCSNCGAPRPLDNWVCPNCGREASGNFCSNCGTESPLVEWICTNCGKTATGNFCNNCGQAKNPSNGSSETEKKQVEYQTEAKTFPEIVETEARYSEPANSWVNNVLMEEHGAIGELKADGNTPAPKEIVFDVPYWKRNEVEKIYVLNTLKDMPSDAVDISARRDGSVMGWLSSDRCLYIAGDGGVRVSENAGALFAWYENVREIHLDGNLHTDDCTNMSHMFYHCYNLVDLRLEGLNTQNVTNMTKMFTECSSIVSLDLSGFETGKVKSFYAMLQKCNGLVALSLVNFNTSKCKNMALMFRECKNLQVIFFDAKLFKTKHVKTMSYMFDRCEALNFVDLSGFETDALKRTNYMFRGCVSLYNIDLGAFDISRIKEHKGMFEGAALESVYGTNGEAL